MNRRESLALFFGGIGTMILTGDEVDTRRLQQERLRVIRSSQKQFNNTYLFANEYLHKGRTRTAGGSIYNFSDKKGKSFYIGANHCIAPNHKRIKIFDYTGKEIKNVKIEEQNKEEDLIILSSDKDKNKTVRFRPLNYDDVLVGEDIWVVGYPGLRYRCVKKSNVSCKLRDKDKKYFSIDEIVNRGGSGGPAFCRGRYVGHLQAINLSTINSLVLSVDNYKSILKKYL